MAAPPFAVEIVLDTLTPYLHQAQSKLADMTGLMAGLVLVLDTEVQSAFEAQADPVTGEPWEPLSDDYVERPRSQGGRGGDATPILQRDGHLARPDPDHGRNFAALTFGEVYAALHQFGGLDDMPAGPAAVPARPYAGVSADGEQAILDEAAAWLAP